MPVSLGVKGVGMFRNVTRLLMIGVMSVALVGCLPESDLGSQTTRKTQTRTAQATGLARSLNVAATQTADAFIRDNAANFSSMGTQIVDINTLNGVALGPAANVVAAGFCGDAFSPLNQSLIVWLTPRDGQNRFAPTALGEGSTGSVMSKLSEISDPTSVGVANGGNLQMGDGTNISLGGCADAFNIPVGAPVMIFANLLQPTDMTKVTSRTETRTTACTTGTGTITERRVFQIAGDGTETLTQGWTTVADLCSTQVAAVGTPATADPDANLDLMGALSGMVDGMSSGELKDALKGLSEEDCIRSRISAEQGQTGQIDYDTCNGNGGDDVTPIADLVLVELGDPKWEYMTGPVTRSVTGDEFDLDNVTNIPGAEGMRLKGHVKASIWRTFARPNVPQWGDVMLVRYKRKIQDWQVTYPNGTIKIVTMRGLWEGDELAAERDETLTLPMEDFLPDWNVVGVNVANLTALEEPGASYTRKAIVEGWMAMPPAPNLLTPNRPKYSLWGDPVIKGKWREISVEPYLCHADGIMGSLYKQRTITLMAYKRVDIGDWSQSGVKCDGTCGPDNGQRVTATPTRLCKVPAVQPPVTETTTNADNPVTEYTKHMDSPGEPDVLTTHNCPAGTFAPSADCYAGGHASGICNPNNFCQVCAGSPGNPNCGTVTLYNWECAGTTAVTNPSNVNDIWVPAGLNAQCSAIKASTKDGVCGTDHDKYSETTPSANLCEQGSSTTVTLAGGIYSWGCLGSGSPVGVAASCSAKQLTYSWSEGPWSQCSKTCGTDAIKTRTVTCKGSDGQVYADNKCSGAKPDVQETCTGLPACTPDPTCGSAHGQSSSAPPSASLCDVGTASTVTSSDGRYNWSCEVSGKTPQSCYAVNSNQASCGCTDGQTFSSAPTVNLCNIGTASAVTGPDGSNKYNWSCSLNGGPAVTCSANKHTTSAPQAGTCGSSDGNTFSTAPTANLCGNGATASWADQTASDGVYNWSCPGSNGGAAASCSASKNTTSCVNTIITRPGHCSVYGNSSGCDWSTETCPAGQWRVTVNGRQQCGSRPECDGTTTPVVNAQCGEVLPNGTATCIAGTVANFSAPPVSIGLRTIATWNCTGSGGGTTASCSEQSGKWQDDGTASQVPPAGACNATTNQMGGVCWDISGPDGVDQPVWYGSECYIANCL